MWNYLLSTLLIENFVVGSDTSCSFNFKRKGLKFVSLG